MRKRIFSDKFKAKIILEVLKGEKEVSVISSKNEIAPKQIRNWKNEFISNASNVFDNKKNEKIREALKSNEAEKDQLYKKVGQLTTHIDWLKKNLKNCLDLIGRVNLLPAQKDSEEIPLSTVAEFLDVNHSSATEPRNHLKQSCLLSTPSTRCIPIIRPGVPDSFHNSGRNKNLISAD